MITEERAKSLVRKKFPGYVIEWCVLYRHSFVVMAHPDNGPEDSEHGPYADPFYRVDGITGTISQFIPTMENDFGKSFFGVVDMALRGN